MQRDLDLEFSRFCDVLSEREKRRNPSIKRKLIRLRRIALKIKRCLEARQSAEIIATIK